jgi:hypothetical protein
MASAKGEQDRTITALRQVSTRALFDIHYNFLGSRRLIFFIFTFLSQLYQALRAEKSAYS